MSKLQQTTQRLEREFSELWCDEIPARVENGEWYNREDFDEPTKEAWVHFQVLFGDSFNTTRCADGVTYRQAGTVQLYIYTPIDTRQQSAYAIADKFRDIFANKTIDGIRLETPFVSQPTRNGNWYESRVSVIFNYDDK